MEKEYQSTTSGSHVWKQSKLWCNRLELGVFCVRDAEANESTAREKYDKPNILSHHDCSFGGL
jgi:hypothetical protein